MKKTIKKATRLTAFALSGAICLGSILWMPHMTAKAAIERQDDMLITGRTTGTLTIKKHGSSADIPLAGAGFSVYRVMELTPAEQPGDYAAYEKAAAFADVLSGVTADDLGNYSSVEIESLALELKAAAISADIQPEASGVTGEDGSCLFSDLPLGYYLVMETSAPEGYVAGSPFLIAIPSTNNYVQTDMPGREWVYDVEAEPKNAQVGIEKSLAEEEDGTAGFGDYVQYVVRTAVPDYPDEYFNNEVTFTIRDIMSAGLDIQKSKEHPVTVEVGGVQIQESSGTYSVTASPKTGEEADLSISFSKEFIRAHRTEAVTVNYDAKVTAEAVMGKTGNKNSVFLDYNHRSGESTTAKGADVTVYSFGIHVVKFTNDEETKALSGAVFQLTNDPEGLSLVESGTSDEEGNISFGTLDAGTYYLTEIFSPEGYTLLANPIKVELIADETGGKANGALSVKIDGKNITTKTGDYVSKLDEDAGIVTVAVENHKGFSLPSTGGMGVVIFLMIGLAGVGVISVAVCGKRKKQ